MNGKLCFSKIICGSRSLIVKVLKLLSVTFYKFVFVIILIFGGLIAKAQGPFPPAAGLPGSTAISKDSSIIKSWANGIEIYRGLIKIDDPSATYNGSNIATFGSPSNALNIANGNSYDVVSLGDGGITTLTFNRPIINGNGYDFVVFENSFSDDFLELAFVEVSSDGVRFVRFPAVSLTQTHTQIGGFATLNPTNLHNLAGKYRQGFGTPFDLQELVDSIGLDVNNIRFVRIIDVVGNIDDAFCTYDSQGNKINDPWPTPFNSCGFDLDAVGVINQADYNFIISNFNDLQLDIDSYWNGSDLSGGFTNNSVFYQNVYDANYGSWYGFAYSNKRDDTTAGWDNQYSAITAGGMESPDTGGTNYAVAFVPTDWSNANFNLIPIETTFSKPSLLNGLYVTNSTYSYLSMKNGDSYSKKFGGTSGNDPDFFKLKIWGLTENQTLTDTIDFFLANYAFDDNSKDYIVDNWRWINLQELGYVTKLYFSVQSTDIGMFGINTPAYFCIDNLTIDKQKETNSLQSNLKSNIKLYPNPCTDFVTVDCQVGSKINIFDIQGRKISEIEATLNTIVIPTANLNNGCYILTVKNQNGTSIVKFIKK